MNDRLDFHGTVRQWLRQRLYALLVAPSLLGANDIEAVETFLRTDILYNHLISEP